MDTIFSGTFGKNLTMRTLLERIVQAKSPGVHFLRVSSQDNKVSGRIFIVNSSHITGAVLPSQGTTGYTALKALLTDKYGTFAYVAADVQEKFDVDNSLNINIQTLLKSLDELPENATSLFDEKSLLDKIFSPKASDTLPSSEIKPIASQTISSDSQPSRQAAPLTGNESSSGQADDIYQLINKPPVKENISLSIPPDVTELRSKQQRALFFEQEWSVILAAIGIALAIFFFSGLFHTESQVSKQIQKNIRSSLSNTKHH